MIKAVIFDMGGVLLRTEDLTPRARLAAQLGVTLRELEHLVFSSESSILAERGRIPEEAHWAWVCAHLGLSPSACQQFQDQFWAGDRLDTHLIAFLRSLRPRLKTALLSNAWSNTRHVVLQRYDFLDVFDVVIFSAEVGMRKPEAGIFQHILSRLEVEPQEAIFVDDLLPNVEAARALGIHAIHFRDPKTVLNTLQEILAHHKVEMA